MIEFYKDKDKEQTKSSKYKPFNNEDLKTKNIILFTDSLIWLWYGFQFMMMPSNKMAATKKDKSTGIGALDKAPAWLRYMPFFPGGFTDICDMLGENVTGTSGPLIHMTRIFGLFCMYTGALNMSLVFTNVDLSNKNNIKEHRKRVNERFIYRIFLNIGIFFLQMITYGASKNEEGVKWEKLRSRMIANVLVTTLPLVGLLIENKNTVKSVMYPLKVNADGKEMTEL